jgi:hypothetical protein
MRHLLMLVCLLSLVPWLPATACAAEANPPLELKIAVPVHHGHRSLNEGDHFHVLVKNVSEQPLKLWTDRYSWGYGNLSFELIGDDGKATTIRKKPRGWDKNYPDWLELQPGETYVLNVNFAAADIWENGPKTLAGKQPTPIKLRALYQISPDAESTRLGIWTGKVQSAMETYAIW